MTEKNKNLTCKSCGTENPIGNRFCKQCGFSIDDTTDIIDFDIKQKQIIADRYEIIKEMGRGAMGIVYKAFDKKLERFVALKTLKFDQEGPVKIEELKRRMILEAKAAAKLEHPNVLVIHDVIEGDNLFIHIAMELIDGISLADIIVPGGIPDYDKIIDITLQICDAMSHAHEKGIIHRDLKPPNILLKNKKTVKITDFGIARIIQDPESMKRDRGLIMGTVPYMSPERFDGLGNDPSSDIYAIGVILYELLTGVKPFQGQNQAELIFRIQNSEYQPIEKIRKDAPPFFEDIVSKSLAKNPSARFQRADDIKNELLNNYKDFIKIARETRKTAIWNVPINRNVNFTGRDDILEKIRAELTSCEQGSNILAVHGLGGMGKTQIALEYTIRYAKDYPVVWWIRAEEQSTLTSEYIALANKLDLPVKYLKENEIAKNLKRWLKENPCWLLVFDNAVGPDDIKGFIPESDSGHILITSRNPKWGGIARTLSIKNWKADEAVTFLQKRTKDQDENSARDLANALGCLPLALEQAGAYIEGSGRTTADYLALFQKHHDKLLRRGKPANYPDTVATTWELSFRKLTKEFPAGVDLLNLLSFFAPDDIPMKIISDGAKHLPDSLAKVVSDPIDFDDALSAIRSYSLIDRTGDSISLHRLVQLIALSKLDDKEKKDFIETTVNIMNDAFLFDESEVDQWKIYSSLKPMLPHALAIAEHANVFDYVSENIGRLLNRIGLYFIGRGQYPKAKSICERALFIFQNISGENNSTVAKIFDDLGYVIHNIGNFDEAKKLFKRSISIYTNLFGKDHPNLTKVLNQLGFVFRDLGDLDNALNHFELALKIDKASYGENHLNVANHLNNIGVIYFDLGKFEKAIEYYTKAKMIYENILGCQHPRVAGTLNNLGRVFQEQGDFPKAKEYFEQAIFIGESELGKIHPKIATRLINLGRVYHQLGDLTKAKELFEKALFIYESIFGDKHLDVANSAHFLALVHKDLGDLMRSKELLNRALMISNQFLGENHPFTKKILDSVHDLNENLN